MQLVEMQKKFSKFSVTWDSLLEGFAWEKSGMHVLQQPPPITGTIVHSGSMPILSAAKVFALRE